MFFAAVDDVNGLGLWRTDGTAAGTRFLKGFFSINELTNVNGTLFFAGNTASGEGLWKSDGTTAGTVLVSDLGYQFARPLELTVANNTLFFTSADSGGAFRYLWKSDGTAGGTARVTDRIFFNNSFIPLLGGLTDVTGTLFFAATDRQANTSSSLGVELWKSDGTDAGTVLVKDINPAFGYVTGGSNPRNLANVNGTLYFSASDGSQNGLWKSNGTAAGTTLVMAFQAVGDITNVNGTAFLSAAAGTSGLELWKSDGTAAGTVLVKAINPGTGNARVSSLTNVNGTLFFAADDGTSGQELWKSDGTAAGTVLVKDIRIGPLGSDPFALTDVAGTLFFTAATVAEGTEPWRSDGTAAGTVLVGDIRPGSSGNESALSSFGNLNGLAFFRADNGVNGVEPFVQRPSRSPTDLALSAATVAENSAANTVVGNLTATDPDANQTFTFSLTDNAGGRFKVAGNQLQVDNGALLDFEAATSHAVTVRVADQDGNTFDKVFTVTVSDVAVEVPPTLALSAATVNVGEEAATVTLTVTRTGDASAAVTVPYATSDGTANQGSDYTAASGTVSFSAGETSKTFTITVANDSRVEAGETFKVTLSAPTGGAVLGAVREATVTITDNDLPAVSDSPAPANLAVAADVFANGREHFQDFVTKAYSRFLFREPDEAGLQGWVNLLLARQITDPQLEAGFLLSQEYINRFGGFNRMWVVGLYTDLLGRASPSDAEVNAWLQFIATPNVITLGFTASVERAARQIRENYQTLLGRDASQGEVDAWVRLFEGGFTY